MSILFTSQESSFSNDSKLEVRFRLEYRSDQVEEALPYAANEIRAIMQATMYTVQDAWTNSEGVEGLTFDEQVLDYEDYARVSGKLRAVNSDSLIREDQNTLF